MTSNQWPQSPRKYCILCVDDDLVGLKLRAAVLSTLFDPFVTAGKPNGTGLGLTLARRVADEHGGGICLDESNRGRTVFTLSLTKSRLVALEDLQSGSTGIEFCSNASTN